MIAAVQASRVAVRKLPLDLTCSYAMVYSCRRYLPSSSWLPQLSLCLNIQAVNICGLGVASDDFVFVIQHWVIFCMAEHSYAGQVHSALEQCRVRPLFPVMDGFLF